MTKPSTLATSHKWRTVSDLGWRIKGGVLFVEQERVGGGLGAVGGVLTVSARES